MGKLQSPVSVVPKPTGHLNTEHFFRGEDEKTTGEGGDKWLEKVRERNRDVSVEERKLRECLSKAKRHGGAWNKTGGEKIKRSHGKRREGAGERE